MKEMKEIIQARLNKEEQDLLKELQAATGESVSAIIKKGLQLLYQEAGEAPSALELAHGSVGKFRAPVDDLSLHKKHLQGYGA